MTPEQQRIKCAEICGYEDIRWEVVEYVHAEIPADAELIGYHKNYCGGIDYINIPDYHNDYAAVLAPGGLVDKVLEMLDDSCVKHRMVVSVERDGDSWVEILGDGGEFLAQVDFKGVDPLAAIIDAALEAWRNNGIL